VVGVSVQWIGLQRLAGRWSDAFAKHDATRRLRASLGRQKGRNLQKAMSWIEKNLLTRVCFAVSMQCWRRG
jgi:hypothetical protein